MVFFTDRDLGRQFPAILRNAGLPVERHVDHFAPDCTDETWLSGVSARGWVAVTHDARIRYKPNELEAVVAHRVSLLIVVGQAPYATLAVAVAGLLEYRVALFKEYGIRTPRLPS